ncbi:MAG: ABC transporter permease [Thermoanaerobaculia bacterium]
MSKVLMAAFRRGFVENVRFARTAILAHKLRAALTVLGIVIGVATVISMVSLIQGFNNNVTASFESFGATLVQFQRFDPQFGPGGNRRDEEQRLRKVLTYEDALAIKEQSKSIRAVSPERYWFPGGGQQRAPEVKYAGREANADTIAGVVPDYLDANSKQVGEGRFITAQDVRRSAQVCVIGFAIADTLFPFVDPIGKWIEFDGRRYEVVGVMEEQGSTFFESTDSHFYLPSTFDAAFPWVKTSFGGTSRRCRRALSSFPTSSRRDEHPPPPPRRAVQQAQRLRDHDAGQADRELPGRDRRHFADDDPHRLDLAPGGRRRGDEHHARLGHRADAGDRPAQGAGRRTAGHSHAVPDRGDDPVGSRRRDRRRARARDLDPGAERLAARHRDAALGDRGRAGRLDLGRADLRDLPAARAARLDPIDALRYE